MADPDFVRPRAKSQAIRCLFVCPVPFQLPVSGTMATQAQKENNDRNNLRIQLVSGRSRKGHVLADGWLADNWPRFLDMHIASNRPGRAVALCDITWMLEHQRFRITSGGMVATPNDSAAASAAGDSAAAAADSPPRALSPAELTAIGSWLEQYNACQPVGSQPLIAVEQSLAAQAEVLHEQDLRTPPHRRPSRGSRRSSPRRS